jgi:2-polyprenyl-6-methoxyphenol hydroxylase-like FAD-dependent oxidoreductase
MPAKILIMGGGVGGLSLAHGLKKHNVPFHVYERDRTESYRAQGYRIRIGGPAIAALKYLLDDETYANFELSCADLNAHDIPEIDAETGRVDEPNVSGEVRQTLVNAPKGWCVDRSAFREVLIKQLGKNDISYDKVFERYEETSDGVITHFADGSKAEGSFLVGAEGRSSRVRKQLVPQLEVANTGVTGIYGKTPLSSEVLKTLLPTAGERLSFLKDRSRETLSVAGLEPILFPHRKELESKGLPCPPDYLFWALSGSPSALGLTEGQYLSPVESEQKAWEVSKHWHPSLRTFIEHQQKGETSAYSITAVKSLPVWESSEHVTLIGDAIHPMAPTGSGAVLAMRDAHMLCQVLGENTDLAASIRSYEEDMRQAADAAVQQSWRVISGMANMTRENEIHVGEMAMQIRAKNART